MRSTGSSPLPFGFWLALAAGLALRVWYLSDLARQPWFGYPLVDSLTFDRIARGILEQGGQPGASFRPPLYPWFLAVLYRVVGDGPGTVWAAQTLLGLAALVPAYRLGERWFGRAAAVGGAWVAACYPLRIFFEGELLDVTLFAFLLAWGLFALWRGLERAAPRLLLVAGLLLGAAASARPNLLLALPFVALGGLVAFRGARLPWVRLGAAAALGVALALAPSAVRNWQAERAFILVSANGGVNFYLGNARGADGLTPVPPGLRWEQAMLQPVREGHGSLGEQERWWYARARAAIAADPAAWARLLARKAVLFVNAAESGNNKALRRFTEVSFPVRHYRWWFGALVCLSLLGCATLPGRGAAFLALTAAGYAVSVVLFFVAERYRLPLVPLLAPAAAAGAGEVFLAARSRDLRRLGGLGSLLAAAALAVFPDWAGAGRERINADFQLGQVHLMRGEPRTALAYLERARAADAADPNVHNSLGAAHFKLGDLAAAEADYRAALALGDFAEVWSNLGVVLQRAGPARRAEAAGAYRRALAVYPGAVQARAYLEALERELTVDTTAASSAPPGAGAGADAAAAATQP